MSTPTTDSIVILGAARTPMGGFQGDFSSLSAHDLGGAAIKAAIERAGIAPEKVDEVLFGNCLMAGQGQAPARQAAFKGGPRCAAPAWRPPCWRTTSCWSAAAT
jgi:acetyl-CoA C-acetyltransferase